MLSIFRRLMKHEGGATAIEYTLIASLIAVAAIVAMRTVGTKVNGVRVLRKRLDDQRFAASRPDVLVYETDPLGEDLTLAGPIPVSLQVSTTGTDADWVVRLIDVHPDGFSQNLAVGILRGRYRDSLTEPSPLAPGKVYELSVDLGPVAATINKGHQMRVDVCGGYFPLFDRNPNTGEGPYGSKTAIATENVLHRPGALSRLILPCRNP